MLIPAVQPQGQLWHTVLPQHLAPRLSQRLRKTVKPVSRASLIGAASKEDTCLSLGYSTSSLLRQLYPRENVFASVGSAQKIHHTFLTFRLYPLLGSELET